MRLAPPFRLPPHKAALLARARRLEWITIGFLLSIVVVMYLAMGSSQAMKTAWIEDLLSLVPPIAFLVAERFRHRAPDARFPWGYHRAALIAFLGAATALTLMGGFMVFDALSRLVAGEHPSIGLVEILGHEVWLGWVMIAALVYSAVPPVILGRMKLRLAAELHEKALHTDAEMNAADWSTALAAILGILGIGAGWWWADSTAAGLIAIGITRDGLRSLSRSIADLSDETPAPVGETCVDPVVETLRAHIEACDWVERADVRLREQGRAITGEVWVVPRDERELLDRLERAAAAALELDWRLHDVTIVPVRHL